jgi:hypothetical protein
LHEAYTSEFFHYSCDFHHKGISLQVDGPLDGLGVVIAFDEIIGDVVMDGLMMLMLWLSQ